MPKTEIATLGGGCFWCLEAVYHEMEGILSAESGYMGGHTPQPAYRDVCTGGTGHAEVVQLAFDPVFTSYQEILEVFFAIHDPTTRDRQGADVGSQYRSVIFHHSDEQRAAAQRMIRELDAAGAFPAPIVTQVQPASTFYRAEDYHQGYFRNNPSQPYCGFVISPKLRKFREKFSCKLRQRA